MWMDQEEIKLRVGDRIICMDQKDAEKHKKAFEAAGIKVGIEQEFGKPVLVVLGGK